MKFSELRIIEVGRIMWTYIPLVERETFARNLIFLKQLGRENRWQERDQGGRGREQIYVSKKGLDSVCSEQKDSCLGLNQMN